MQKAQLIIGEHVNSDTINIVTMSQAKLKKEKNNTMNTISKTHRPPNPFKGSSIPFSPQITQLLADFQRLTASLPQSTPIKSKRNKEDIGLGMQNQPLRTSIKKIESEFLASMNKLQEEGRRQVMQEQDLAQIIKEVEQKIFNKMQKMGQAVSIICKRLEYLSIVISIIGQHLQRQSRIDYNSIISSLQEASTIQIHQLSHFYQHKLSTLELQNRQLQERVQDLHLKLKYNKTQEKKMPLLEQGKDGVITVLEKQNHRLRLEIITLKSAGEKGSNAPKTSKKKPGQQKLHPDIYMQNSSNNMHLNNESSSPDEQQPPIMDDHLTDLDLSHIPQTPSSSEDEQPEYWQPGHGRL